MKKIFLGAAMFFAIQSGFAQSQDAKTFVANMGIKQQLDGAKEQILPSIEKGKEADFTKEFDAVVTDFTATFSKLVDENYDMVLVKEANKKFAETKEMTQVMPKDAVAFQEKVNNMQNEIGMSLQGLVMKYADKAALEAAQE
ncbi:hypothetical protein H1R17_04560 [Flavobacterium sp. xlx-214]|uniref:hypothetical protein n=1 Tax=unclassified Flavobacterium TaxID=196869 RepID=UPI0013D61324|nr:MULTISPECIES: hypothetical protein [unclassified Flavobacterium]MBA5792165.1 hypothetical protein [Flavobacterium sp. xlx-221]QMI84410.1 hypothetical protein H1R17_04560 [Flavobacterium sp. xlx-214]